MKKFIFFWSFIFPMVVFSQQSHEETTTYSYDNLNRLVQVIYNDGTSYGYVYDNLGNRIQLDVEILGIDEEDLKNTITLYPNPPDEFLSVQMPENLISETSEISLYDVNGRLLKFQKLKVENRVIRISVENLSNGVYLLRVTNNDQNWSQLFIKK